MESTGFGIAALSFFGFLAIAVVAGTLQEQKKAALAHDERLKRLSLGLNDPPSQNGWPLAFTAVALGLGVPLVAFVASLAAYLARSSTPDEIWLAAVVVSIPSVVVGGRLASRLVKGPAATDPIEPRIADAPKPSVDPDALDVVGRRG
jgi:hypothetical protein